MDTTRHGWGGRHHRAIGDALFMVMLLVLIAQTTMHVEAVTYPGDIEALKEVGSPLPWQPDPILFTISLVSAEAALCEAQVELFTKYASSRILTDNAEPQTVRLQTSLFSDPVESLFGCLQI